MSQLGPHATTRLVLCAHVMFMDRDGSNCRVGVRRLASVTGLNKDTVAAHRGQAIQAGWLITSGRSTSPNREVLTAVPDGIAAGQVVRQSSEAGQLLSGAVGQSNTRFDPRLTGQIDAAVRSHLPKCPVGSDISLPPQIPLSDPTTAFRAALGVKMDGECPDSPQARLRMWMLSNETALKYLHDAEALTRLVPFDCRYPGYEGLIRLLSERMRKGR